MTLNEIPDDDQLLRSASPEHIDDGEVLPAAIDFTNARCSFQQASLGGIDAVFSPHRPNEKRLIFTTRKNVPAVLHHDVPDGRGGVAHETFEFVVVPERNEGNAHCEVRLKRQAKEFKEKLFRPAYGAQLSLAASSALAAACRELQRDRWQKQNPHNYPESPVR